MNAANPYSLSKFANVKFWSRKDVSCAFFSPQAASIISGEIQSLGWRRSNAAIIK